MDDEQLQQWVERVSLQYFALPFRHKASFNGRLSATGGRYFTKSHNIEISSKQLEAHGIDEVEKIIKHELCHYHLHIQKRGYKHRDPEFRALLNHVGGSRYCTPIPGVSGSRVEPYRYKLECKACGMQYLRKRKVNAQRYACGRCRGRLKLLSIST